MYFVYQVKRILIHKCTLHIISDTQSSIHKVVVSIGHYLTQLLSSFLNKVDL